MARRCNVNTTSDRFLRSQKHILSKQRYILFKLGHIIFKQKHILFHTETYPFQTTPQTSVTSATSARKPGSAVKQVIALQPHETAKGSEELSFPKDAVMFVVAQGNPQHWKGVWEGKAGLIPASKVQPT